MLKTTQKIKFEDYLLMFLLMGVSGNRAFDELGGSFLYLFIIVFELVIYRNRIGKEAWNKVLWWAVLFVVIFVGQLITLKIIGYLACINYIFKVATAIFAVFILKDKFAPTYFNTMVWLSKIALFFWGLNVIGVYFPAVIHFSNDTESLIFYTQPSSNRFIGSMGVLRNFGMFWEPGAYAGYLLIAFFLFINRLDYLWLNYRKSCIVLIIALLTTFSTTGYIIFSVLLLFFLNDRIKNKIVLWGTGAVVFVGLFYIFNTVGFLGNKILSEYNDAVVMDQYDVNFSRFGAFMFDLQYIRMHPIFGNGLLKETRFSQHIAFADNLNAFGNGFSGEIAYFGIPFMLIYLISVYRNPSLKQKWRLLILIVLLLQGEYFMNYPMYFIFPFVTFFNEDMVYDFNQIKAGYNG